MPNTYTWQGAGTRLPDGHRIFETHDHPNGARWAIADASGHFPQNTDDGILWLDRSRCLNASTRHAPTIPLLDGDEVRCSTPTDTPTVLFLSRMLGWTIQDETRGHFYTAGVGGHASGPTLADVHALMTGREWSSDTTQEIAELLIRAGFTIDPPSD